MATKRICDFCSGDGAHVLTVDGYKLDLCENHWAKEGPAPTPRELHNKALALLFPVEEQIR